MLFLYCSVPYGVSLSAYGESIHRRHSIVITVDVLWILLLVQVLAVNEMKMLGNVRT